MWKEGSSVREDGEKKKRKNLFVSSLPFPQDGFLVVGGEFWGRDKDRRISGLVYTGAIWAIKKLESSWWGKPWNMSPEFELSLYCFLPVWPWTSLLPHFPLSYEQLNMPFYTVKGHSNVMKCLWRGGMYLSRANFCTRGQPLFCIVSTGLGPQPSTEMQSLALTCPSVKVSTNKDVGSGGTALRNTWKKIKANDFS